MSFDSLLTQTAIIKHRAQSGTADAYNTPAWVESATTAPTYVSSPSATEVGPAAVGMHRALFAPDVAIDADDLIVVDGTTYEVVGIPRKKWNPRAALSHHITVELVEVQD